MPGVRSLLFLILLVSVRAAATAPSGTKPIPFPKHEVRAVWVTTAAGLDWPWSTNRNEQRSSLRTMVATLKAKGFNTIIFQVRPRGDAYYRSRYEPWADRLTGTAGKDPGWDPLATLLTEAHALGMEVHAWFNVFKIRGPNPVPRTTPEHPSHALAAWCFEDGGEIWLDPGRPEVRTYLINVAMDLIRSYDIDGINFDFIRYPGHRFNDSETHARYGNGMRLHDWRRQNITAFVREFYQQATRVKPRLRIGSSPLGVYRDDPNGRQRGSYYSVFQDSYGWLKEGIHDYVSPQVYWVIGAMREPDFAKVVQSWRSLTAGRHVYGGIAAYRPDIFRLIGSYVDTVRDAGLHGQAFFRLENVLGGATPEPFYRMPASIPPMPWKDPVPPMPVDDLAVEETAEGVYRLTWTAPPAAADGDTARYYNIYRWTDPHIPLHLPESRVAITLPGATAFVDTAEGSSRTRYYYAITAADRSHNESIPSEVVSSHTERVAALPPPSPPRPVSLGVSIAHDSGVPVRIQYSLPDRSRVAVDVLLRRTGIPDTMHAVVVRAVQDGGSYSVDLSRISFPAGAYIIRLTTEHKTIEQNIRVGP